MEWSKNTISKAELEKKQREFMEQAMRMAKRSVTSPTEEKTEPFSKAELIEEKTAELTQKEELSEEVLEEALEEITEKALEEVTEEALEDAFEEIIEEGEEKQDFFEEPVEPAQEEITVPDGESYGVFDKDELTSAIERGEITGEGLRQAAEILAEMTNKTELMKKLLEEQEEKEKTAENGEDYGLNSFINRHNNSCRGCEYGKDSAP